MTAGLIVFHSNDYNTYHDKFYNFITIKHLLDFSLNPPLLHVIYGQREKTCTILKPE